MFSRLLKTFLKLLNRKVPGVALLMHVGAAVAAVVSSNGEDEPDFVYQTLRSQQSVCSLWRLTVFAAIDCSV